MNWWYAVNNDKFGPVDQAGFDLLVRTSVISNHTLVWREGMPGWVAYSEFAGTAAAQSSGAAAGATVRCTECGQWFAVDQVVPLGHGHVCAACKPIALQKLQEGVTDTSVERIRNEHIKHEASVKSVGVLYFLGGGLLILFGALSLAGRNPLGAFIGLFILGLAVLQIWVGTGLRSLKSWARIPTAILSGFGLLGFPIGTLINGYILYLVLCKKGVMVFSEDYKQVIAQTPHIRYRTSIVVWIALGVVILLLAVLIVGGLLGRAR